MIKEFNEEIINIKNEQGEIIHCVYNYTEKNLPLIVIPPQFEKTIRTNLTPMVYLINNNFNVFRFDNRYHNGNSTGEIINYSLPNALKDLNDVVKYIETDSNINTSGGVGILGISISSRVVYRFLSSNHSIFKAFVSLVGVVNMRYTLNSILGFDVVGEYLEDKTKKFGVRKVLKYPIDWDNFLFHLTRENYHSLDFTKEDIDHITTPTYLIVSEQDSWINLEDFKQAFKDNNGIVKGMYKLPGADHELYKNPQAAEYAMGKIVTLFRDHWSMDKGEYDVIKPEITEIIKLNSQERERERKYSYCMGEKK